MHILHVIPSFQHPTVRGPTRHYHFARELSKRHNITLLSLVRTRIPPAALADVQSFTERLLTFDVGDDARCRLGAAAGFLPVIGGRASRMMREREGVRQMKDAFTKLVRMESYDVVLFHGKCVFPVIEGFDELPVVIDFCDATSMRIRTKTRYASLARRPLHMLRHRQVRRVEQRMLRTTPQVAYISRRDRQAIAGDDDRAVILPNGVDRRFWQRSRQPSRSNRIVFTGVMDYAPNHDGAVYLIQRIMPRIVRSIPDLEVFIVGRDPLPALKELARRHDRVTVTGFVDDVRPYLEDAAVFAAPLRYASGTQNKVLEAMAMEVPVVTTPVVAEGLHVGGNDDTPVEVAEGAAEFADATARLLRDPRKQAQLTADGVRYVDKYFDWTSSAQTLEQMCYRAIGREPTREGVGGQKFEHAAL